MTKTAAESAHICPVEGCVGMVSRDKLMCFNHWFQVPWAMKRAIFASWNAGHPTQHHARHCADAVAAVNAKKGAPQT